MAFIKAERKQSRLKLAITGPSGSGKTFSALLIAKGMGKKIALIDTENKSASLYAGKNGLPEFDVDEIEPPYTTEKYLAAIDAAVKAGYDTLIIDSISHQWAGEGGLLQKKEALDQRPGSNSYTNWAKMTPEHEKFKAAILHANIDMICTMRSKQDYVLAQNDKGKQAPQKVGMAPIQREAFEYEFALVLDMDMSHQALASKDRTGLFDGKLERPTEKTGQILREWLNGGAPVPPPSVPAEPPWQAGKAEAEQIKEAMSLNNGILGWEGHITEYMQLRFKKERLMHLTKEEFEKLLWSVGNMSWTEACGAKAPELPASAGEGDKAL